VSALHHILTKCAKSDERDANRDVVVALPGPRYHFQGFPGKYKSDGVTETLTTFRFPESNAPDYPGVYSIKFFFFVTDDGIGPVACG
jgi:hypothetical protein